MRIRPAKVAIVDDDVEVAIGLAAELALDERIVVDRFHWTLTAADLLGRLLASRADLVVLDLDGGRALPVVARSLGACGVEVVVRSATVDPELAPGCVVVGHDAPVAEVVRAVRSRFAARRGRPAPPRLET